MRRRELLVGSACLAAAATAFASSPRGRFSRLGDASLAQIVPQQFDDWSARDTSGLAPATSDGSLSAIYDEIVERVYSRPAGDQISILLAHGGAQTNALQLHRPEACYAAVGFDVAASHDAPISVGSDLTLPARQFVADAASGRENVVYWTRIGDYLPTTAGAQRVARIKLAIDGEIADGVLVRFSVLDAPAQQSNSMVERFIQRLLQNVSPGALPALVGDPLARAMVTQRG